MDVSVVYQDDSVIVAVKPAGLLSEDSADEKGMPSILRELTGADIYTVHRLDRATEGLMVYAAGKAAAGALSAMAADGRMKKIYLAIAEGETDECAEAEDLLYYDRTRGKSYVVKRARRGVKPARLRYERAATAEYEGGTLSLLRVELFTGRTHQIRVQMAHRRHPLLGDRRYGSHTAANGIALCACELAFPHPVTGEMMTFTHAPEGEIFGIFDGEKAENG